MPRGSKPAPPGESARPDKQRFPWQPAPGEGWQHGDPTDKRRRFPKPPAGLQLEESVRAWNAWMSSWVASFWKPMDLPGLELLIHTFDAVRRGAKDEAKLIPLLDRYGITPKGQQDLRWSCPKVEEPAAPDAVKKADQLAKRREERAKRLA